LAGNIVGVAVVLPPLDAAVQLPHQRTYRFFVGGSLVLAMDRKSNRLFFYRESAK
jgi:hypothetical protein